MEDIIANKPKASLETTEKIVAQLDDLPLPEELQHLDEEERHTLNRSLVRRLDCTLMPVVALLFLLNILDRNNIANAKIAGLTTTLGITNSQYNTCLMIFYVGCKTLNTILEQSLNSRRRCNHSAAFQHDHHQSPSINLHLLHHFGVGSRLHVPGFYEELWRTFCLAVHSRLGGSTVSTGRVLLDELLVQSCRAPT